MDTQQGNHNTLDAFRHAKIDAHKTWRQIAAEVGVTEQYILDIMHGRRKGAPVRKKIADALGVTVQYLWPTEEKESA